MRTFPVDVGTACGDGAVQGCAAEGAGERAAGCRGAGVAAGEGRGAFDADQRYSAESDGSGAAG